MKQASWFRYVEHQDSRGFRIMIGYTDEVSCNLWHIDSVLPGGGRGDLGDGVIVIWVALAISFHRAVAGTRGGEYPLARGIEEEIVHSFRNRKNGLFPSGVSIEDHNLAAAAAHEEAMMSFVQGQTGASEDSYSFESTSASRRNGQ